MKKTFGLLFILTILFAPAIGDAQQNKQGVNKPEVVMEKTGAKEAVQNAGQVEQIQSKVQSQTQKPGTISLEQNTNIEQKGSNKPEDAGTKNVEKGSQNQNQRMVSRKSTVANVVQEMERIATRNQGIGDQVRIIAQNQNNIQEKAENALKTAQKRSGFARFFIGPNYEQLKTVEKQLKNNVKNLAELEGLKEQIQNSSDKILLDEQIKIMEVVKQELLNEVAVNKKGFSLLGWIAKILAK
ncbi:hypothetical protein K8R61_02090 [bacterium]|nr:hypothetical protein [bacterium]